MGISLKKIGGTIAGSATAGGLAGAAVGNRVGAKIEGDDMKQREEQKQGMLKDLRDQENAAREASIDPRLRGYGEEQMSLAQGFRANQGNVANDLRQQAGVGGRLGLAKSLNDIRAASSSRGLLYSGLRQGQEAGAQGQMASNLANQAYQTNQGLETQGRQMEGSALEAANRTAQAEQSLAERLSGKTLQEQGEKAKALGSLGGGVGQMGSLGLMAAKSGSPTPNYQQGSAFDPKYRGGNYSV